MTDAQFAQLLEAITRQAQAVEKIADSLDRSAKAIANVQPSPAIQARGPLGKK